MKPSGEDAGMMNGAGGERARWAAEAERGDPDAQYELGRMYANGRGVEQDHGRAAELYQRAADQGHAVAQSILGQPCFRGEGVERDHGRAAVLCQQAAGQGNAQAQCNLAELYHLGEGVEQDHRRAAVLWQQAADQGDAEAQYSLGRLYHLGKGVEQDYSRAVELYQQAADQGFAAGALYGQGQGLNLDYKKAAEPDEEAQVGLGARANSQGKSVEQDYKRAPRCFVIRLFFLMIAAVLVFQARLLLRERAPDGNLWTSISCSRWLWGGSDDAYSLEEFCVDGCRIPALLMKDMKRGRHDESQCRDYHKLPNPNKWEPEVRVCLDQLTPPCNVISIGIDYDFLFDDFALSRGCRVWSFDPSMKRGKNYQRHATMHRFFHAGIGAADGIHRGQSTLYTREAFEEKRLQTIMREMNVSTVDVVRLDAEGAEWEVLREWLRGGLMAGTVRQLLIEVHDYELHRAWANCAVIKAMMKRGMQLFWTTRNQHDPFRVFEMGLVYRGSNPSSHLSASQA